MAETAHSKNPTEQAESDHSIALIQVPDQRLCQLRSAVLCLDLHPNTWRQYADLGRIEAIYLRTRVAENTGSSPLRSRTNSSIPCGEQSGTERRR